jgi:hypothetical protein
MEGIIGKLLEGGVQVAARLFVLPAETAPFPDIGPAISGTGLFRAPFRTVAVRVTRLVHAEQVAQIIEMLLRPARSLSRLSFQRAINCSGVMGPAPRSVMLGGTIPDFSGGCKI